jgi:demethylmenaquinone methyltransferase/2-methoxy-6-polyprenyl-1,4-benzoquinol methylase
MLNCRRKRSAVTVWREVEDALEAIIDDYERVNHVISLFQDDRARLRGLKKIGPHDGVKIELGSGPGNFTEMLRRSFTGALICLDYSDRMLSVTKARNEAEEVGFVRGVFEALPFRGSSASFIGAAYALRDSTDKKKALEEARMTLRDEGRLLVIDIGKPNNSIVRGVFSLYMRYIVPLLGGLLTHQGYRNPWRILYKTYELLPVNRELEILMRNILGNAEVEERALGGLLVATAVKV